MIISKVTSGDEARYCFFLMHNIFCLVLLNVILLHVKDYRTFGFFVWVTTKSYRKMFNRSFHLYNKMSNGSLKVPYAVRIVKSVVKFISFTNYFLSTYFKFVMRLSTIFTIRTIALAMLYLKRSLDSFY